MSREYVSVRVLHADGEQVLCIGGIQRTETRPEYEELRLSQAFWGRKVVEAVETAIDECIREHILENFFLARKDELMNTDTLASFAALESDPNRGPNR